MTRNRMGKKIYEDILVPMFRKSNIQLQCIETQYSGHIKELLATLDLKVRRIIITKPHLRIFLEL